MRLLYLGWLELLRLLRLHLGSMAAKEVSTGTALLKASCRWHSCSNALDLECLASLGSFEVHALYCLLVTASDFELESAGVAIGRT